MKTRNSKSGSATILICTLVAMAGTSLVKWFGAMNDAQIMANQTGAEVAPIDMIDGTDVLHVGLAGLGGAGTGWAYEQLTDNDKDDQPIVPTVQVTAGGDAQVTVSGNDATSGNDQGNRPTTTTTSTTTATPAAE